MATYRIQNIFNSTTGLVENQVVNTFHFQTNEVSAVAATASLLNGKVAASYEKMIAPNNERLTELLGPELSRVALPVLKAYDATQPGSPIAVDTWAAFSAPFAGKGLPGEVALCLSYRSEYGTALESGPDDADADLSPERPRSRRRGRVFIGPLLEVTNIGTPSRPTDTARNILLGFGQSMANDFVAGLQVVNAQWVVRSKAGTTPQNWEITQISVDNAWDTQRRRGVKASVRTTQLV